MFEIFKVCKMNMPCLLCVMWQKIKQVLKTWAVAGPVCRVMSEP